MYDTTLIVFTSPLDKSYWKKYGSYYRQHIAVYKNLYVIMQMVFFGGGSTSFAGKGGIFICIFSTNSSLTYIYIE